MARPRQIDLELVCQAQVIAAEAIKVNNLEEFCCALAVLLPELLNATLEQTALVLCVSRATVPRMQARLRRQCAEPGVVRPTQGGRRRESLTPEEERRFLEPWEQASATGEMLVVAPIRAALAQKLGRPVAASVVYRMLARHDWRKVAPDTRHPKSDPQVQEEWKKNSPKHWQPSQSRKT